MQSAFVQTKVSVSQKTVRPVRCAAVPAAVDRRQAFGLIAAGVAALAAPAAEAITLPAQESTGSTVKKGSLPTNTSEASMSSYTMEGIKKRGIDKKRRKELLAEIKEQAAAGKFVSLD